jgi:hypothetical protein
VLKGHMPLLFIGRRRKEKGKGKYRCSLFTSASIYDVAEGYNFLLGLKNTRLFNAFSY